MVLLLFAIRLLLLVEIDAFPSLGSHFRAPAWQLQSPELPLDSVIKVPGFSVGRRERIDESVLLPLGQLTGSSSMLHSAFSVSAVAIRAGCEQPSEAVVRTC